MNVTHVIVHTPEQVREIVTEAAKIAAECGNDASTQALIFREACSLLGQRWTFAVQPSPIDLAGLHGLRKMAS